MTLRRKHQSSR